MGSGSALGEAEGVGVGAGAVGSPPQPTRGRQASNGAMATRISRSIFRAVVRIVKSRTFL
jgi:hypothetical protein